MNVESILQRDRLVVAVALSLVVLLSWIYVLTGAGMGMNAFEMTRMSHSTPRGGDPTSTSPSMASMERRQNTSAMSGPSLGADGNGWSFGHAALMFFMWWVMMVGMMLPSASPMLLLYARMMRKERGKGAPFVSTGVFAAGYVVMWGAFSAAAVGVQWGLQTSGLLSQMLVGTSSVLGAVLLIAAGAWQLSPLKLACLKHCQSPIAFLSRNWQSGAYGAFKMGVFHGAYCLGCCWFLMALLFYGGVMNLYWIVGLALYVLAEKMLPAGLRLERFTGPGLLVWGSYLLLN